MGSVGNVIRLINKGNKQKCLISNLELFESDMTKVGRGWIGNKYFKAQIRTDYPGLSKYRRGRGWFKAN